MVVVTMIAVVVVHVLEVKITDLSFSHITPFFFLSASLCSCAVIIPNILDSPDALSASFDAFFQTSSRPGFQYGTTAAASALPLTSVLPAITVGILKGFLIRSVY